MKLIPTRLFGQSYGFWDQKSDSNQEQKLFKTKKNSKQTHVTFEEKDEFGPLLNGAIRVRLSCEPTKRHKIVSPDQFSLVTGD